MAPSSYAAWLPTFATSARSDVGIQGGALLANAFRDPDLMTGQVRHLDRWIDSLT
jgi:hypothetical protein